MKKILTALAISAFAYNSADAQMCTTTTKTTTTTTTVKPAVAKRHAPVAKKATAHAAVGHSEICKLVPYNVYKIQPDRKTVVKYQTTDLEHLTPLNNTVTYYGNTGAMPDRQTKVPANTVIVKAAAKGEYCRRDAFNKQTVCFFNGTSMTRDADGNYSY